MSRKGKLPIALNDKVKVDIQGTAVTVTGPKGTLKKTFAPYVQIHMADNVLTVTPLGEDSLSQAMQGTVRSILVNMVQGVQEVYSKDLEIQGVGFKAAVSGSALDLALGFSHPIQFKIPEGISIQVKEGTKIHVEGADKHLVGQVTANIKSYYPVEPYKGKGVRVIGEFVRRKEGKKKA